jgi:hypothetical protein
MEPTRSAAYGRALVADYGAGDVVLRWSLDDMV